MNTLLTLNTAAFAVPVLLGHDPECVPLRHGLSHGTIVLKVLPDGPAVSLVCGASGVLPVKGELPHPSALVLLRDLQTANDFLNGKLDTFVGRRHRRRADLGARSAWSTRSRWCSTGSAST